MRYIFQGGDEFFEVELVEDIIMLRGALTNNKQVQLSEGLFKPNREKMAKCKLILKKWKTINKEEREVYITIEFAKLGYDLKTKYEPTTIK